MKVESPMRLHITQSPDDLPKHLKKYYSGSSGGFDWFHHPLLVQMFPICTPKPLEEFIAFKQQHVDDLLRKRKFAAYLAMLERGWRMDTLISLAGQGMFDGGPEQAKQFWKLAADVWVGCEASEDDDTWSNLMSVPLPCREFMTKRKDRDKMETWPDEVPIWRGVQIGIHQKPNEAEMAAFGGWQWTTKPRVARFFARRFLRPDKKPVVAKAKVHKKQIAAYLTSRNEFEVLIPPYTISNATFRQVSRDHEVRAQTY